MKNHLRKITQNINGKKTAFIVLLIVVFHLALMFYLVQDDRHALQVAKRSAVIQKIINAIYLVEATPDVNRKAAVAAMADPDIQVEFTKKPTWKLQFEQASFWKINRALEGNLHAFAISIKLEKNQWLNINAKIYSRIVYKQLLLMFLDLIVFGSILIAFWTINRFTTPLKKIKISAERLGIDLENKPIDVYGPTVVKEVSLALNQMQKRILQLIRNRTQMLAAISHDLRTPIARARLRLQFIPNSEHKIQLLTDLDEMEKMISETLAFAHEDSKQENKKNIDLASLLKSICDDANDMGHQVTFQAKSKRIAFTGRPIALKRAFTNLIDNAIRYGGNADVAISEKGKSIIIKIKDAGPGIKESDLEKVFEPYYRAEYSRSRNTGGSGLGLSVTRDIILSHAGRIKMKNRKPSGLNVTVGLKSDDASLNQ